MYPNWKRERGYIISIPAPLHAPDLLQVLLSDYSIMSLSLSFLFWTLKESPLFKALKPKIENHLPANTLSNLEKSYESLEAKIKKDREREAMDRRANRSL